MSFKQLCGCRRHEELTEGLQFKVKKLAHRPFPKADVESLISEGLLSERATYLCDVCASFSKSEYGDKLKKLKSSHIESTINDIECGKIESEDLVKLATALGKSQYDTFKQEARETSRNYSEAINDFSLKTWLQNKNTVLLAFINGIVGNDGIASNKKQTVYVAAAIDCLMAAIVCNCITPLFFIFNLISYFFSGSKTTACVLSALSPSGSYYTMKNWFKGQLSNICKLPANDIITFFDNNQVLSRNWRVRFDAKVKLSVITSVIHILTRNVNLLQLCQIQLDPYLWLYHTQVQTENVIQRLFQFLKHCSTVFQEYRNKFVIERLNKVYKEQLPNGTDFIDTLINDINTDIPRGNTNEDPYSFIEHNHPDNPPDVKLGEPVLTNPCSYDSVNEVLNSLLNSTVNNTDRKWTILGCDGLPYILASRLIEKDETLQHILLQPGLGHYEINMVKALFKLLWEVALSDLAQLMGYKSIKAQVACQNATDHHKSWQILHILLYATADELVLPYVRKSLSEKQTPSLTKFYDWLKTVKDSNYIFMQEAIFTYVYSLFLFRAAVRRNNSEVLLASRTKFSSMFYGFNMTSYQEIDYRDLKMRLLAPPEIQNYIGDNESFSTSGHASKGEGGDFVLENRNKRIKSLIPKGVPTEDVWLQACRSFDTLDKIRTSFMSELDLKNDYDATHIYHPDLQREIQHWRRHLRITHYLDRPEECRDIVSVSGQILDQQLVNFGEQCKGNQLLYLEDIMKGNPPGKGQRLTPVHITSADRQKFTSIQNKTMAEIKTLILREIEQIRTLGCEEEAARLRKEWDAKIQKQKKQSYIMFYTKEVLIALDEATYNHPLLGPEDVDADADS